MVCDVTFWRVPPESLVIFQCEAGMTLIETIKCYRVYFVLTLLLLAGLYSSVIPDMVVVWYRDDNYSHGFFVPFIAGYFLYRHREELAASRIAPSNLGFPVIILALIQFTVASLCMEYFTLRSSLVVLIAGLVLYFFGTGIFKKAFFSIILLVFMVPLPQILYNAVSLPLKTLATKSAVGFMQVIGMTVMREGNIIMLPNATLEVVEACSGIRSLLSLLTLSTAYAFLLKTSPLKRMLIIIFAVPLAIFMNALRVIETGILVQKWGAVMAQGFYHGLAGIMVFMVSMLLLMLIGKLLCGTER